MRVNRSDQSMDYRPLYGAYSEQQQQQGEGAERLVNRRTGNLRVSRTGVPLLLRSYFLTPFHTLLQSNWLWLLIVFVAIYVGQFAIFGAIYLAISPADDPCIGGVATYADAYSFSMQTAMTIGYGEMYPKPECTSTWILITIQCILMLLTDAVVLGTVFEKLSRPEVSSKTMIFSEKAVICKRNGVPRLLMRTACVRRTFMVEAHVRLYVSNHSVTREGERIFNFKLLPLAHNHEDYIFLGIPFEVEHIIDEDSPLHGVSDLSKMDIEFLVLVEGIIANMSDTVQSRFSYRPKDIIVDHKFVPCVSRRPDGSYHVDYDKFHFTVPVPPPLQPSVPLFTTHEDPISYRVLPEASLQKKPVRTVTFGEDSVENSLLARSAAAGVENTTDEALLETPGAQSAGEDEREEMEVVEPTSILQ